MKPLVSHIWSSTHKSVSFTVSQGLELRWVRLVQNLSLHSFHMWLTVRNTEVAFGKCQFVDPTLRDSDSLIKTDLDSDQQMLIFLLVVTQSPTILQISISSFHVLLNPMPFKPVFCLFVVVFFFSLLLFWKDGYVIVYFQWALFCIIQ